MNKLSVSFLWDFLGKMGNQIITFIIGIILARLLSPSEYGLVGIALIFITFTGIFSNLGLNSSLIQRVNVNESHLSSTFFLNFFASIFLAVIFFLTSNLIADYFNEESLIQIIKVLSLSIIINGFSIVQESIFRREMKFDILSKVKIYSAILSGLVGVTLAFLGFGVWSLVAQYMLIITCKTILYWIFSKWRPSFILSISSLKELWSFGFNMFLSSFIYSSFNQVSSIVIAKIFSSYDLGLFTRAKSLNEFTYRYSSESISSVTFSKMSKMQDDRESLINLGMKAETLVSFISFGLLGLMYIISEPLILFLLGEKWVDAVDIYKLLCLSGFSYPISVATLSMLKAAGFSKTNLKLEVYKTIIGVIGLIIGFRFGLKGYLISLIFTGILNVYLNIKYTSRILKYNIKRHIKPIISYSFISVLVVIFVSLLSVNFNYYILNLIFYSVTFVLFYVAINYLLQTDGYKFAKLQITNLFNKKNN